MARAPAAASSSTPGMHRPVTDRGRTAYPLRGGRFHNRLAGRHASWRSRKSSVARLKVFRLLVEPGVRQVLGHDELAPGDAFRQGSAKQGEHTTSCAPKVI